MKMKGLNKMLASVIAIGLVILAVFVTPNVDVDAYDINATSNAQITVNINNKTIVDVTPQNMDWGANDPGTIVTSYTDPDNGIVLSQIQIENLGSTDITYVWANVTQPAANPFGTGLIDNYNPGNWLALRLTAGVNATFIDRIEFNSSYDYVYLNLPATTVSRGKIRNAFNEYFWALNTSDGTATCDGSIAANLVVGQVPHNESQTGTIDLVGGNIVVGTIVSTGDATWGGMVDGLNVNGDVYCVAVKSDCSAIRLYRWNADVPGATLCTAFGTDGLTLNGGTPIYPGGSLIADVELHIPYGVPDGTLPTGNMYIIASAA